MFWIIIHYRIMKGSSPVMLFEMAAKYDVMKPFTDIVPKQYLTAHTFPPTLGFPYNRDCCSYQLPRGSDPSENIQRSDPPCRAEKELQGSQRCILENIEGRRCLYLFLW